ncbi:MAG: hypothetical protein AAFX95_12390 [Cyanobacteria bacterium J06639_16]
MQSYRSWVRHLVRYTTLALLVLGLTLFSGISISGFTFGDGAVWAQASLSRRLQRGEVSEAVYQRLPNLPMENQYVNVDTGDPEPGNTLATRLVRYHLYTKGRITQYRLDWKLTLADYLGANEPMDAERYPLANRVTVNPLEGDRQVITGLSRRDRDQLIQVLIEVCHPELAGTLEGNDRGDGGSGTEQDGMNTPNQPVTGTGAADLLR